MHMKSISRLLEIIPTPNEMYVRNDSKDWLDVFQSIGTRLPEEFIQFNKTYGDGYFVSNSHRTTSSIEIFGSNKLKNGSYKFSVPEIMWNLRTIKQKYPNKIEAPLFWEPNGFLPWGRTTNESILGWVTNEENPDKWQVAILRPASKAYVTYPYSMVEFLIEIFLKKIESDLLPKNFPGKKGVAYEVIKYGSPRIY